MENVLLTILLINALLLIGVVLLQRSEGGGLLSGGGVMSGRSATTALAKLTWLFGTLFFICAIALTIVAARNSAGGSVVDRLGTPAPVSAPEETPAEAPASPLGTDLLPPAMGDAPATPPRAD